jgi:hypothetical protein
VVVLDLEFKSALLDLLKVNRNGACYKKSRETENLHQQFPAAKMVLKNNPVIHSAYQARRDLSLCRDDLPNVWRKLNHT